ncbi:MAG: type IV secretory pathway protease TraF [Brevundimonas sp.]|jgi:type IV secretory pathway protease TraF|uniref:S26 family signal peptidase n=1 Tax=Brevundimonas sp. TaxID=1871086 RepID=UPI0039E2A027
MTLVTWHPPARRARGSRTLRRAAFWAVPLVLLLTAGAVVRSGPPPILINETASLQRGLYLRIPRAEPARGSIAAVPQPDAAGAYLARLGVPPELPLIKRVAAAGGDRVCADGQGLIAPYRVVAVRSRDRQGRPLPVWRGCRILEADELLLLGDSPNSFDGRYFGPVRRNQILGIYREAITW